MSKISVGFIGAGRVAKIMLGGWKRAGKMPSRVVLYDCEAEACEALKSLDAAIEPTDNVAHALAQGAVFLAVHPPVIKDAAESAKAHLGQNTIVVSLAPKFTIEKLSDMLGGYSRLARTIPNAPSIIGRGFNPLAYGEALDSSDKDVLTQLLQPLGECPEVEESHLEAYAILSAMGPTYFWPQIYALESLGESFGLNRDSAMEALDKMLWGTVATIRESGLSPEQVKDLIPVKPMEEEVRQLVEAYSTKLGALYEKIRP